MTESNGQISFYAGDFGAELPFAEIVSIKQIDTDLLGLTGVVGDRYQPSTYKTFNAWLGYHPDGIYSCFTLKRFVY